MLTQTQAHAALNALFLTPSHEAMSINSNYLALHENSATEISGTGYARFGITLWTVTSGQQVANNETVIFSATANWLQRVTQVCLYGSSGGTDRRAIVDVSTIVVNSGEQVTFAASDLKFNVRSL